MIHVRGFARSLTDERKRLLQLSAVVFVWQAFVGIYFLSLVQQYLPNQLHAGLAYSGYAMAAYGVAKFIWQTPAGWLSDRIGRRTTMLAGVTISVPALWMMMDVPNEQAFLVCSAVLGIGAATMWPAFMAHVGETTPHGRRNRTMSLLNVANMAGIGLGTFAGVLLVDYVTYTAVFWLCIGFNALALVMVARGISEQEQHAAPAPLPQSQPHKQRVPGAADAWTPSIPILAAIVLFLTLGTSLHTPMIGAYTKDVLHVKMSSMALLFPAPAALAGILFWRYHGIADRHGRMIPLVAGLGVAAACIFALTLTRSPIIVVNLVVLAGLAYAISVPAWGAAALDATDAGGRGLWLGALTAIQGFGVAGGQALGGVIGGVYGPLAPFKIAALLLAAAVVLIVLHARMQAHRRGPKLEAAPLVPALAPVPID